MWEGVGGEMDERDEEGGGGEMDERDEEGGREINLWPSMSLTCNLID